MALVVGTDSYVTLSESNTYWSNRNNSTWSSASDANKEKAIREATQYIDGAYTFIGVMTSSSQALAFPRSGVYITEGNFRGRSIAGDVIPDQIKSATCELALEALGERLDPTNNDSIAKVKVDVIEVDYADFAPSKKTFSFVSKLLSGLVSTSSGGSFSNVRLERT
jgi:hypothetical protein